VPSDEAMLAAAAAPATPDARSGVKLVRPVVRLTR